MSDTKLEKILILDDNSDYRKLIKTFISKLLPSVEAIEYDPVFEGVPDDDFNWSEIDVLLLDYHLSIVGTTGLDILHKHHKKPSFPATIMLTGAGTEEVAVRALKTGIYEYQPKQSLTKDKLKQSIIHAWENKKSQRKKQQEITQHNKSFSKEVFYENLENAITRKETERALVLIKPDNIEELEQLIGIIGRDSLVNHIGKNSFEVFKVGACNPNITRTSDTAIAVQIDNPGNQETLEFNMQGLCKHLAKCTFKFSDEKYKFTVSIGLLKLGHLNTTAEQLIQIATAASQKASEAEGNSFYIWKESDVLPDFSDSDAHINTKQVSVSDSEKQINAERESLQLELKAVEEAKNKLEAELKAAEESNARAEAALNAAAEAKEKAEAEAEAKERAELEAKLKAEAEAKERAELEAKLKAEAEAKERAELEVKEKAEAEAKERAELEAKLKAEAEAKERAELEAKLKAEAEAKERAELEVKEKAEAEAKERADLEAKEKAETEAKERAELEAKLAIEAKEKMEAELKTITEAKEKAEAEMKAAKEAKEKLEAKLKVISVNNKSEQISTDATSNNEQADVKKENEVETTDPVSPSIEKIEEQIKKLIDEKRIIQTYQPVMAMFDDGGDSNIELYKTGLQAIIEEDNELNEMLVDISIFSISLQQIINEWVLRQIFLRITETGKSECKNHFLVNVTDAWFSDISLFNWLQKILSQTKKYAPGKSIILNIPIDIFNKHKKRAKPLIDTLHKSYNFRVAISNIESLDTISTDCQSTSSKILMLSVDKLQQITAMLGPDKKTTENDNDEENNEKQNLLQHLKTKGIHIITTGIEDATLLTDAITNGTDYAIGSFIGEVQNSLVEPGTVETFDLT
jgi:CheY-like chemotaxis protein